MSKCIWIINQYASHLETRHWELAKSFAGNGYRVAVITSSYHHGKHKYLFDEKIKYVQKGDGITYVYLHSNPEYSSNGAKRVLNMICFSKMVNRYSADFADKIGIPSYVIASSAPPFVWESGYKAARKYNAKFIAEFRDIWPLSLIEIQGVNRYHPFVLLLSSIEKRTYRRADAIVSTMPYAYKHVIEVSGVSKDKIFWMPNGINVREVQDDLISDSNLPADLYDYLKSNWCGVYIGSIAKCECLDLLLSGFKEVNDPDIFFAVIGEGNEKDNIINYANELNLQNVKFFPAIDRHLIPKVLANAKFAAAAIENHSIYQYGLSMNKLNDYLVSGIPTVFACDVDNVVKDAGHFVVPTNDKTQISQAILKVKNLNDKDILELKERAQKIISDHYDYTEIGKNYLKMMESL